jgi:hypothetical protein
MGTASGKPLISALERLQSLPALFRGTDLTVRFGWDAKTASQYVFLWKRRSLIQGLGGHSDVFANLLVDKHPDWDQALRMAMPSAVAIGLSVLHEAGWTTQIPARRSVAVDATFKLFKTDLYDVTPRGRRWFASVAAGVRSEPGALPRLAPAWALADLLRDSDWGAFGLHRDDIEWDAVGDVDERDWSNACAALGVDAPSLSELAVAPRTHYRDR